MRNLSRLLFPLPLLAASLAFHASLTPAQAVLIAGDQFATGGGSDYTAGGALFGQSGAATGMTGAWTGASGTTPGAQDSNNISISSTNLTLSGVNSTVGGSVQVTTTGAATDGSINESRSLSATASGSSAWFGFLLNSAPTTGFTNRVQIGLVSGTGSVPATSSGATGAIMASATTGVEGFVIEVSSQNGSLFLRTSTGSTGMPVTNGGSPVATTIANQTSFGLFQLQANTSGNNDTLNFWLLSSAPATQAGLGSPTFSSSTSDIFSSLSALDTLFLAAAHPGGQLPSTTSFDAIRLGDTYLDAVPEPSISGLLLLGGAGALFPLSRLRRRVVAA